MAHPQDQGRCLLDGYLECGAILPEACVCAKMPEAMARELHEAKYGVPRPPVTDGELPDA